MNWLSGRLVGLAALIGILIVVLVNHGKKEGDRALRQEAAQLHDMTVRAKNSVAAVDSAEISEVVAEEEEFFPADPQALQKEIEKLLKGAGAVKAPAKLTAMVVPHAGIRYSGKVAAKGFALLKDKKFDTVVILAPNHRDAGSPSVVICPKGHLLTPAGKVEVDEELARALRRESSEFVFDAKPFAEEHGVRVQLPFLQRTLGDFKVLPVLLSGRSAERCARLADALLNALGGRNALILATTHLSSGETPEKAKRLDFLVTSALERCDAETLLRYENEGLVRICGYAPVMTLFYVLREKGIGQGKVLEYATSAENSGDKKERIVGYAAMAYPAS